ncbi:MAG: radical SAM protein with 4Fe4S-binding SPASM domain [Bradymonadia bacterium]|jgi:radical SAM protein with 4Fe4S-binding SPASM domain
MDRAMRSAWFGSGIARGIAERDRISTAIFFLTDSCNAKCPFCFDTFLPHLRKAGTKVDKDVLTVEDYRKIAVNMPHMFQVMFGGGEPFLRKEIDEIAAVFHDHSRMRLLSIPTNGSLPDRVMQKVTKMAERCRRATLNIEVSIDAFGEKHDRLRVLPGGFKKAIGLAHELRRLGDEMGNVNLVINTTVSEHNIDDVVELTEFLADEFSGTLRYHNIQYDHRLGAKVMQDPELISKVEQLESLELHNKAGGNDAFADLMQRGYIGFINSLVLHQILEDRMIYDCNAGRKLCVVMANGRVGACEPFIFEEPYENFTQFNLRDHDFDISQITALPEFKEQLQFIKNKSCESCPWSCAAITSMTFDPVNWRLVATVPPAIESLRRRLSLA